jgi:Protein of unknown function (DUF616)
MKDSIVIYTAITGNYDQLRNGDRQDELPFVAYLENSELKTTDHILDLAQVLPPEYQDLDANRRAKWFKLHPHKLFPDFTYSIWIDGNVKVVGNINQLISENMINTGNLWAVFPHKLRNCIFEEVAACVRLKKDDPQLMFSQITHYFSNKGYPRYNGLAENTIIVRKHNHENVIKLNEMWWQEILTWSKRDQLSFNYCCWQLGFNYGKLDGTIYDNKYFVISN